MLETYQNISNTNNWNETEPYRIHLVISRDDEGVFSAVALNLPGAGSCGATEEEAVENALEAVRGVLETYKELGQEIPWEDPSNKSDEIDSGCKQKVVIVHV